MAGGLRLAFVEALLLIFQAFFLAIFHGGVHVVLLSLLTALKSYAITQSQELGPVHFLLFASSVGFFRRRSRVAPRL